MILRKSFKNIYLIIFSITLAACSTTGKNTNKNPVLNTQCMSSVPLAVGEKDANILLTSAQLCKNPQSAELWQQLAQQFFTLGKYDKAVQAANILLKLQPDNTVGKDIVLRSGLKITGHGLEQMKGSMQFLYGDTWSEASQVASQINQSRGEKPLQVMTSTSNVDIDHEDIKKTSRKRTYSKKTTYKKPVVKKVASSTKTTVAAVKPTVSPAKAQNSKPANPFSSFN